jgi:hypothetical protein
MEVQELENNADIRLKFASINERGGYDGDAAEEYQALFPENAGDLTEGWRYESVGVIETRFEYDRNAWRLAHPSCDFEAAAVEHETGIEILVLGIASGVGTAAIVGLGKWLWRKWRDVRDPNKQSSSFVAEKVTERGADGKIRRVERIEMRGPVEATAVNAAIEQLFEGR